MSLQVPPEHVALLKKWLELPDGDIEKYSEALTQVKPQFNPHELAKVLIPLCAPLEPSLVLGITVMLITVYRTGEPKKPFEKFLDGEVRPALQREKMFSDDQEESRKQWTRLRRFFLGALRLERVIGTTAKAGLVLTEHERIFDDARILTDLRPIYHADVADKPDAGLIVHMLKVTYRDKQDRRFDTYYALDSNDLAKLREVVKRAADKEIALRRTMEDAGLTVLKVEPFY